jgi:hypothetical protein
MWKINHENYWGKNAQVEHKRACPMGNNNNRKGLYKRLIEILHPNFDEIYTAK